MTVYRAVFSGGAPQGIILGYIIQEGTVGEIEQDVRELIADDTSTFGFAGSAGTWSRWSLSLYVPTIGDNVQGFAGLPAKFKLGQIAFSSVDYVESFEFWNYQRQTFSAKNCLVEPSGYTGYPDELADIPAYSSVGAIVPSSSLQNNLDYWYPQRQTDREGGFFGNTKFSIYPESDFEYNTIISYYAVFGTVAVTAGGIFVPNF